MTEEEKAQLEGRLTAARRPLDIPTLVIQPSEGPLAGRTLTMRRFASIRYWIANERGAADNVAFYEEILDAIEEHDLGRDPASLPAALVAEIGNQWIAAMKELAVPPTTGNG